MTSAGFYASADLFAGGGVGVEAGAAEVAGSEHAEFDAAGDGVVLDGGVEGEGKAANLGVDVDLPVEVPSLLTAPS